MVVENLSKFETQVIPHAQNAVSQFICSFMGQFQAVSQLDHSKRLTIHTIEMVPFESERGKHIGLITLDDHRVAYFVLYGTKPFHPHNRVEWVTDESYSLLNDYLLSEFSSYDFSCIREQTNGSIWEPVACDTIARHRYNFNCP